MDKMALTKKQGFSLPRKELTFFDGDPLDYWNFTKSFQNSITANASSESEKLIYLLQYTSGVAKDTIECCLVMDSSLGYQMTLTSLHNCFEIRNQVNRRATLKAIGPCGIVSICRPAKGLRTYTRIFWISG